MLQATVSLLMTSYGVNRLAIVARPIRAFAAEFRVRWTDDLGEVLLLGRVDERDRLAAGARHSPIGGGFHSC
jgi:hypothetical protein